MNGKGYLVLLLTLLAAAAVWAAEEQTEPPAQEQEAQPEGLAPEGEGPLAPVGEVQMVELRLDGRTVQGRLVFENDELVRVESVGQGVIGYERESIRDLRRFAISVSTFHEQQGDYVHDRAGRAQSPLLLRSARRFYEKALLAATTDEDKERLESKLAQVAADREEVQLDALRADELQRAHHQTELVKIEAQLTKEKLASLQRQEQEVRALREAVRQINARHQVLIQMIEALGRTVEDLEGDIDDLRRRDRVFIRNTVFLDLKRSHDALEGEVNRLRRDMARE